MARIELDRRSKINGVAAHHEKTQGALRRLTREVEGKARSNLAAARATTGWDKIADPSHMTKVGAEHSVGKYGAIDYIVWLEAYKGGAMALEFGHAPSGVFGPGGKYADIVTKAPHGLYILTRASGLGASTAVSSGRPRSRNGKRLYKNEGGQYKKTTPRKRRRRRS